MGDAGSSGVSVRDFPQLNAAFRCALPIFFVDRALPDLPGTQGTCFGVALAGGVVFLTAAHVLRSIDETDIEIPLRFGKGENRVVRIATVTSFTPETLGHDDMYDFAVMVPEKQPVASDHFAPLGLDLLAPADAMPKGRLLGVAGYPRNHPTGNVIDYEGRTASLNLFHALGTYDRPSSGMPGCHQMLVQTAEVGGPQHLSGAPVLMPRKGEGSTLDVALGGLVIRGNEHLLHFIDSTVLAQILRAEQHRFFAS